MTLDGNSTGGFINGLAVAEGATVTLYITGEGTLIAKGGNGGNGGAGGNGGN